MVPKWLRVFSNVTERRFSTLIDLSTGALATLALQAIVSNQEVFLGFLPHWCAWIFVIQGGVVLFFGILQVVVGRRIKF